MGIRLSDGSTGGWGEKKTTIVRPPKDKKGQKPLQFSQPIHPDHIQVFGFRRSGGKNPFPPWGKKIFLSITPPGGGGEIFTPQTFFFSPQEEINEEAPVKKL